MHHAQLGKMLEWPSNPIVWFSFPQIYPKKLCKANFGKVKSEASRSARNRLKNVKLVC